MRDLIDDLRYAFRGLLRSPGFTFVVVLTLALGIGANTTIFSVVSGVLGSALPYAQPERLVTVQEYRQGDGPMAIAYPNYLDWLAQNDVFDRMGLFQRHGFTLSDSNEPRVVQGARVSSTLFETVGVRPALGRVFTPQDDQPGGERNLVVGYGLWQRSFGADPGAIGKSVSVDGEMFRLIGVMPRGYAYPARTELWTPIGLAAGDPDWMDRGNHPSLFGVARLKPGLTFDQAVGHMNTIASRLAVQYPQSNAGTSVILKPVKEDQVGGFRPAAAVLLGAVGLVLLIACANVANLLLVRSASRQREIAVRAALGAGRWRIARQMLTESTLLALLGGGVGLLLSASGTPLLVTMAAGNIPRAELIHTDLWVLVFTLGASVLTGLLFGLAPALHACRANLANPLKEASRTGGSGLAQRRVARGLVTAEVALALVLLTGAALLTQSLLAVQALDPGYEPRHVLTFDISLPTGRYSDDRAVAVFAHQLRERIGAVPGVESCATTTSLPLEVGWQVTYDIGGRPPFPSDQRPSADFQLVTADYFKTMGIQLLRGQAFRDRGADVSIDEVIINDAFAAKYWPGENPIGKTVAYSGMESRVVGVVRTVKAAGLDVDTGRVQLYGPHAVRPTRYAVVVVKTAGDPLALRIAIADRVHALDAQLPLDSVRSMEQVNAQSLASRRVLMSLVVLFSVLAVVLAAVGVYGVIAYAVAQRTRELGIRIALGARSADLIWLVLREGLVMAGAGSLLGVGAALGLGRVMSDTLSTVLFKISPSDPATIGIVVLFLVLVAALASLIPARRAARLDPVVALQAE